MIDLHSHLLPGVDDGSRSVAQSVTVLTRMRDRGVTGIVLTPHLEASRVAEGPPPEHDEAYAALLAQAPAGIQIYRGAEVMLDRSLAPRAVETRRITLGGSRYVLVEFTRMVAARSATAALGHLVAAGLVPLVAHPERYAVGSVALVSHWREVGARIQVDANTLFAPTGRGVKARRLVAAGLADVLAADNHGDGRSLIEPFAKMAEHGGEVAAGMMMISNPAAILADKATEPVPPCEIKVPILQRLRSWLGGLGE